MMKAVKAAVKSILFVLIFVFLFSYLSELFTRKTLNGAWNHTQKISGFYNEPENEFDIMYFGSSNTYCSFNPLIFYEETGIKSYVFASQQQPVWASYAYIKEALKTQDLKLIVLDVLMFSKDTEYYDDGVNYSFMDDIPLSVNKIELAAASAERGKRFELLFNFLKYHSRWSELTKEDYEFKREKTNDYLKGYVLLEETFTEAKEPEACPDDELGVISKKSEYYLNKIIELSKKEKIPLLLVKTPSNAKADDRRIFNTVKNIAAQNGIKYIDYNAQYDEIGFEMDKDFYDKSHLNYKGAEKFTRYFAEDIISEYFFDKIDDKNNTGDDWKKNLDKYYEYCSQIGILN